MKRCLIFKELDAINAWMRTEHERKSSVGKRLLSDSESTSDSGSTAATASENSGGPSAAKRMLYISKFKNYFG